MKLTSIFMPRVSCPSDRENHEKCQCLKGKLKGASLTPPAHFLFKLQFNPFTKRKKRKM